MEQFLPIELGTVVLDCLDIEALSDFYVNLLGWKVIVTDEEWIAIQSPNGGTKLGFQLNPDYVPPVWPEEPQGQQQMLHLDFNLGSIERMEQAVQHAIACGASKADVQYDTGWTVMIDPAGHPFCFLGW